jgi:hypothetical protein
MYWSQNVAVVTRVDGLSAFDWAEADQECRVGGVGHELLGGVGSGIGGSSLRRGFVASVAAASRAVM